MDSWSEIADEVALEGLDGITIPTLWIRLENKHPKFPLKLDDSTKGLIWRFLSTHTDLSFYELPTDREDVVLVDRYKVVDQDSNVEIEEPTVGVDIYPIKIIPENKDGLQGSCVFFKERIDITKHVRSKNLVPLLNLEEVLERYGRKLVVVASQMMRFRALIGSENDPELKLGDDSYCILEKVGRSRWHGEIQGDLHGSSFKVDPRKFHYLRKSLVRHKLITMQRHCRQRKFGHEQYSLLLLLKRFHNNRLTKSVLLIENICGILQQMPGNSIPFMALKDQLNISDGAFKRSLRNLRLAKMIESFKVPLEDLDPGAGPCTNKNGSKVLVPCIKLLKPCTRKGVTEDDDDDDEDEELDRKTVPSDGRFIERDIMSQAYHLVLSAGPKGIAQRDISLRMNVDKLESRMLCRKLMNDGMIKCFMEDEGRQRTAKYISHRWVGTSDKLQLFVKEQERNKLLYTSTPQMIKAQPPLPSTPQTSKPKDRRKVKSPAAKKRKKSNSINNEGKEEMQTDEDVVLEGKKINTRGKKAENDNEANPDTPVPVVTQVEYEPPPCSISISQNTQEPVLKSALEKEQPSSTCSTSLPSSEVSNATEDPRENQLVIVEKVEEFTSPTGNFPKYHKVTERSHETYRLLRRKNLIVEAVHSQKVLESIFPLQKLIHDEEKQYGFSTRCCKKTLTRIVQSLCREGLLKIYTTTVIQDGISKKVEMITHPSIKPNDDLVAQVIEQVRFKITTSSSVVHQQPIEEKHTEQEKESEDVITAKTQRSRAERRKAFFKEDNFKPVKVPGMSRNLGYQPKMHRLRVIHTFLWYIIYGHPLLQKCTKSKSASPTPAEQSPKNTDASTSVETPSPDNSSSGFVDQKPHTDLYALLEDENKSIYESTPKNSQVFTDDDSWKRFVPPVRVVKDYGRGWAMVGDLLLCMPLSVFIQIIQINYKVDGLQQYLDDPLKQHYLLRTLPAKMRRQLLYKRRYIYSFHENLMRLAYMGLLQFSPREKFMDKEQTCVYVKQKTTIVDTTNAEPHYWLITELPDKPFERRHYTLRTTEDVENFWFDLMCVCLNTPLGVIRGKRNVSEDEPAPSFVKERNVFVGIAHLLKGSREVCDDGSIPGDGKGAGGLDSNFFGHLKRNWLWTSHLLSVKKAPTGSEALETKIRLKSLLSKNALRLALTAGGSAKPRFVTPKKTLLLGNVEVGIEPATRNQQIYKGKRQKTKRAKKEIVKATRKRKRAEPMKRTQAHDEADHRALKRMKRQRVQFSVQEDSLMMLCCVASHLLNSKLPRPFVPHCVVRDLLHAEFKTSLDKTSIAVGRRSRFIFKNPQTLQNYRVCLAEVSQDKSLMKQLEEFHPADPEKSEDCVKAFLEYIRLLRQKFSSVMSSCNLVIPDTKQELFSRFSVSAIYTENQISPKDSLSCTADIHSVVLHNLIQSTLAMTNSQMKSTRSFQTFYAYSKYDQELLCRVFLQCRKHGLVNRRRVSQPFGPKKNRSLPILPMSFQLSQSFYRCFSWRFPPSLCRDSLCFLRSLINNGRGDNSSVILYHETDKRPNSGEQGLEIKKPSKQKAKQSKGEDETLRGTKEQPEMAESDSPKEQDNALSQVEEDNLKGEGDVENNTELTSQSDAQKISEDAPLEAADVPTDVPDMMEICMNTPGGSCAVSLSLMSLGLLSVHVSIPNQVVVVDSTLVDNDVVKSMAALEEEEDEDDDDDDDDCEVRKKLEVKATQASHTNYLIMRGYCSPGIINRRNLNPNDNIVVESCILSIQLRNTPVHQWFTEDDSSPLNLNKCGLLLPSVLTYSIHSSPSAPPVLKDCEQFLIEEKEYSLQDIEACAQIRKSLDEAGEGGLEEQELYKAHIDLMKPQCGKTRSLPDYMKDLAEEGLVVRVGGLSCRWVLMQHANPWLLTLNSKKWSGTHLNSENMDYLKHHRVPFMRKRRCRGTRCQAEEPMAKKLALDQDRVSEAGNTDGLSHKINNEVIEEEPKQVISESGDETPLGSEKEAAMQTESKEEEDTEERMDKTTEQKDGQTLMEDKRDEEAASSLHYAEDDEALSFISRPWRMVDGKLNRSMCKGMLEAVMFHIMSKPGITQHMLVKHYKRTLQPMVVMDLVQALIQLGCVKMKTMVKSPKPSLFGHQVQQTTGGPEVSVPEPDTIYYEPTISCCLRLCHILPNERHWNTTP
ncbi:general transcription factor 3C polypeptide 1 [Gouania willdenowi]|uniref:general transcription factor 3C polypeptide 1 n=1 Tax=Gouania willdenowi TaxID=441366 RepID=UPI001056DD87|nr:general transcription factor 3C polypeptide 1 [Gouania willdenowi]XP_028307052.1 general transcription factor 3C polypeptide 1 [Gouania willdenowi]XP_028307059.1 general transcription factor 3C polypeptide 1 [Gouania willdenowi]